MRDHELIELKPKGVQPAANQPVAAEHPFEARTRLLQVAAKVKDLRQQTVGDRHLHDEMPHHSAPRDEGRFRVGLPGHRGATGRMGERLLLPPALPRRLPVSSHNSLNT